VTKVKKEKGKPGSTESVGLPARARQISTERGYPALRRELEAAYILSETNISVRELSQLEPYKKVPKGTIESWNFTGEWNRKRKEYQERIRLKFESEVGTKLVRDRLKELTKLEQYLDALDEVGAKKIEKGKIKFNLEPKSLEGFLRARLELSERVEEMRANLSPMFAQQTATVSETDTDHRATTLHPNLRIRPSTDEALVMAMALLHHRQEQQEKELVTWVAGKKEPLSLEAPKKKRPPPDEENETEEEDE